MIISDRIIELFVVLLFNYMEFFTHLTSALIKDIAQL